MERLTKIGALSLALAVVGVAVAAPAVAGHHEKVLQVVAVDVAPGMLDAYKKQVKQLNGVMKRVGSNATMRMWRNDQGGPDTGTILVALEHANAEAWAADTPKIQGDSEWQKIIGGLDKLRTVEGSSMWKEITPAAGESDAASGSVLVITGVRVNPGKLADYRQRVGQARVANERLGLSGRLRMWQATLAGANAGNVAVAVEYKDLATYVAEDAKLSGDAEWQKILAGLSDIRTLGSRSLYVEITP